ncbi:MAG: tetratricopeptide repeat protein [Sphingomonas sp.]
MGWLMMAVIGIAAAGLLLALGVGRGMWTVVGAALMVGAIGYALQGSPTLPDHPVRADAGGVEVDPGIIDLRGAMFGRYGTDAMYLTTSDGLQRAGETQAAARLLLGGIHHTGGDAELWTELGTVIATHDQGYVSAAARLAFRRAAQLAPDSPGPPFFEGLAYVRGGDFAHALPLWQKALALTPQDADYRADIAVRLDLLDRYMAMMQQEPGAAPQ